MKRISAAPGEGERQAQRGYVAQYGAAAAAIYAALCRDELLWIGLADRDAGAADDLVLGLPGRVVAHQFKISKYARSFRLRTLLLGVNGLPAPMVTAWKELRASTPNSQVEVRLVTNDYPSTTDNLASVPGGHSAALLLELELNPERDLAGWRETSWTLLFEQLFAASGLSESEFNAFLGAFRILSGAAANFILLDRLAPDDVMKVREIAAVLPRLVADRRDRDRWDRIDLLTELGWRDSFAMRREHRFPIGAYVQRNEEAERALRVAIAAVTGGYVALVGPPGSGKSTLLQLALASKSGTVVVRYLAFIPGETQGMGRGEAEDFLDDVNAQLRRSLSSTTFRDVTIQDKRRQFEALVGAAGQRLRREGVRTILVVDGLDHVPREEKTDRSLLAELPLPSAIPDGVIIVLGTQRLDLDDLPPAITAQASLSDRNIGVKPLSPGAVRRIADAARLGPEVSRALLFELSLGHPLMTRYLVEALRAATSSRKAAILGGELQFDGDVETVYARALRDIESDPEARRVMDYIARAEGFIPPEMLAEATSESAVELALACIGHLLDRRKDGWRVFHNSFRLFVLNRPRLRYGKPDASYGPRTYQELAELARLNAGRSPQRWLELRYLAKAGKHAEVLALTVPGRFREQLAAGRAIADLLTDVRLVFAAVRWVGGATDLFRVLLIQDELDRRGTALEYAPALTEAYLAVGELGAAQASALGGSGGYKVVDALVASGDVDSARALFDQIEPLAGFRKTGRSESQEELGEWSQRVHLFRDAEQIGEAIDRLVANEPARPRMEPEVAGARLRAAVALAAIARNPATDPNELARVMCLPADEIPFLLAQAAFSADDFGPQELGAGLLRHALDHPSFDVLPDSWRRRLALMAFFQGDLNKARDLLARLPPPSLALLRNSTREGAPRDFAEATIGHAQLAALLGKPWTGSASQTHPFLWPIQFHASTAGLLVARASIKSAAAGEVARSARSFLLYLEQVLPAGPGDFHAMTQIATAAPVIATKLIEAASAVGQQELDQTVREFEAAFTDPASQNATRFELRREVALTLFRETGDLQRAIGQLNAVLARIRMHTPEAQVEELALGAIALGKVGDEVGARDVLRQIHGQTLGNSLAPKKDPQYAMWLELLERANAADFAGRAGRVAFMMRQLSGMTNTQGDSSAVRIASAVLTEAALVDAATGLAAGRAMACAGLLPWHGLVTGILLGVVRRRSDMGAASATAWCSLALPFHSEPHYRSGRLGEFVAAVIGVIEDAHFAGAVETLRGAIAAESIPESRAGLFECLVEGVERRGAGQSELRSELRRWRDEAPARRDKFTPGQYDDIRTLAELEDRCQNENAEPSWERGHTFARLVQGADLGRALNLFELWPDVRRHTAARFALVDGALAEGRSELARQLVVDYADNADEDAHWSSWLGGGKLAYHRSLLRLDGGIVHSRAFADLAAALAAGREGARSLLQDVETVLPVICAHPDWPAMWEALAEQLAQTREYEMGLPFTVSSEASCDEAVIAALFRWASSLPIAELDRHVHVGALRLLGCGRQGTAVFEELTCGLLAGQGEEVLAGLLLLHRAPVTFAAATIFASSVRKLVDHPDYLVGVVAARLADRWNMPAEVTRMELPAFYRIVLNEDGWSNFSMPPSVDPSSGAMRVEDPRGWTAAFGWIVRPLARGEATVERIRKRAATLIAQWGSLDAFGYGATKRIRASLDRLDMRLPFARPHMIAAFRGLRHVAGEMRRAGLLDKGDEGLLLHLFACPPFGLPVPAPAERPAFLAKPFPADAAWEIKTRAWLAAVETDLRPPDLGDEFLLAEISWHETRDIRGKLTFERIRFPSRRAIEGHDLDAWMESLPRAGWFDGLLPLSGERSPVLLRSAKLHTGIQIPERLIVLCPYWTSILGWRMQWNAKNVYVDLGGREVASITWWRDGGPHDVYGTACWGEGIIISLSLEGRRQIETQFGELTYAAAARREVILESGSERVQERLAKSLC